MKNETNNIRPLVFSFSPIYLAFWWLLVCFFMWFVRFKTLICEPQSIWHKLLLLSWLYLYWHLCEESSIYLYQAGLNQICMISVTCYAIKWGKFVFWVMQIASFDTLKPAQFPIFCYCFASKWQNFEKQWMSLNSTLSVHSFSFWLVWDWNQGYTENFALLKRPMNYVVHSCSQNRR